MTVEEVRKESRKELSDPSYSTIFARLLPNVEAERICGVRLPHLRKLAKEIAKGRLEAYLEGIGSGANIQETMIQGFVIGYAKMEWEERWPDFCVSSDQITGRSVTVCVYETCKER